LDGCACPSILPVYTSSQQCSIERYLSSKREKRVRYSLEDLVPLVVFKFFPNSTGSPIRVVDNDSAIHDHCHPTRCGALLRG
jgi:hypothetical protein